MAGDGPAVQLVPARGAGNSHRADLLHRDAAPVCQDLVQEVLSKHGRHTLPDHDVSSPLHVQPPHQDGFALDHELEIHRGYSGVLLQHLEIGESAWLSRNTIGITTLEISIGFLPSVAWSCL